MDKRDDIRNIAIIAHVDHGKTTLVDQMLKQSGIFRADKQTLERVMDSNDLERERGITILSKNTAVMYNNIKINIIDTPGHADFGGEVERILAMVDGVLLLVDAYEGCMPQTRFVLKKALSLKKKPVVVINKIDRKGARPNEVVDEILDLFIELGADEDQLEFPIVYASAKEGYSSTDVQARNGDMKPLFDAIIEHVPPPAGEFDKPVQILITNIDYDEYIGRIGIGRVERGSVRSGQWLVSCTADKIIEPVKMSKLFQFDGLRRVEVSEARLGDIVAISGISNVKIGETVCDVNAPEPLDFLNIDEPTITMNFMVNDSPFAGNEGRYVTSRHLRERLFKELETNVSLRVEETGTPDVFKVSGRGELHLSILIETMRREGYEFQVSKPNVIFKTIDNIKCEPIEMLSVDVPSDYVGVVMEKLGRRKAEMINMSPDERGGVRIEFKIPSRGLMGYRSELLVDTKGYGNMNHLFLCYEPYKGDINNRQRGSIIAWETGETTTYGLYNAQERGRLFIGAGVQVYEGVIVGENAKAEDLVVNVCKKKHVTNIRAASSDEALRLITPAVLSLEQCMEFIAEDEYVEVTPKNIRMRKKILSRTARSK